MISRILLAVDRVERGAGGRGEACQHLASSLPATVEVLHVHETPLAASLYDPEALRRGDVETAAQASLLVERTVASLRDRGVHASGAVRSARGSTVGETVATAREGRADLLVMGALGVSHFRELRVGGVAQAAVQLAPARSSSSRWAGNWVISGAWRWAWTGSLARGAPAGEIRASSLRLEPR